MSAEREPPTIELSKKKLVALIDEILVRYEMDDKMITYNGREDTDVGAMLDAETRIALDNYFDELDARKKCPECGQVLPEDD